MKRREFLEKGIAEPAGADEARALTFVGCGRPLITVEVRIVDEAGREAADREQGRVEFRGPSATAGYYRNAAATRRVLDRGWIDSGDLGYIAEGELYVTGRAKDLIIRAGRNIHPQELEEAVGVVPGIRLGFVAVFGVHNARSGTERLVVAAETRATAPRTLRNSSQRSATSQASCSTPRLTTSCSFRRAAFQDAERKGAAQRIRALYEKGELRRKRRSAGLQMARLALSSLGPGLARAARAAERVFYAAWSWGTVFAFGVPLWLALAAVPGIAVRRALLRFPSVSGSVCRHPCVRRGAVEHPHRTPFRARPQPCELPRFLRPVAGSSRRVLFSWPRRSSTATLFRPSSSAALAPSSPSAPTPNRASRMPRPPPTPCEPARASLFSLKVPFVARPASVLSSSAASSSRRKPACRSSPSRSAACARFCATARKSRGRGALPFPLARLSSPGHGLERGGEATRPRARGNPARLRGAGSVGRVGKDTRGSSKGRSLTRVGVTFVFGWKIVPSVCVLN